MGLRRVLSLIAVSGLVTGLAACGGSSEPAAKSASDKASGLSISVAGDQVTLKRAASSASGTAGTAGQVSCTTDYSKLVSATTQPAPSVAWYAATLITWPDKAKETTATLSHSLTKTPDLCIAQSSDQQTSVVVYFGSDIKAKIAKQQVTSQRDQQAANVDAALTSAAQAAVAGVASGKFPAAAALVTGLTSQGLYVKSAATPAAATESGTIYVIEGSTTTKQVVLSLTDANGKIRTATQKTKGSPKLATPAK